MPNHIKNVVFFSGNEKKIKKMREEIGGYDPEEREGDYVIDFNKLIPMPKELDIVSGSASAKSHLAYCIMNNLPPPSFSSIIMKHWQEEIAKTCLTAQLWIKKQVQNGEEEIDLKLGEQIHNNIKKYGCESWYDWRIQHWGTKWNCYECEEEGPRRIAFLTAWAPPTPIFEELAKRYPKIDFTAYSVDEGDSESIWIFTKEGKTTTETYQKNCELVDRIWDATGEPYKYPFKEEKENAESD